MAESGGDWLVIHTPSNIGVCREHLLSFVEVVEHQVGVEVVVTIILISSLILSIISEGFLTQSLGLLGQIAYIFTSLVNREVVQITR